MKARTEEYLLAIIVVSVLGMVVYQAFEYHKQKLQAEHRNQLDKVCAQTGGELQVFGKSVWCRKPSNKVLPPKVLVL